MIIGKGLISRCRFIYNFRKILCYSVLGAFTDINIWKDTRDMSKMQSWSNFSVDYGGDYLNWTSVKLNVSNMVEDNISGDEIRYIKSWTEKKCSKFL